jgi:hypothetical protein
MNVIKRWNVHQSREPRTIACPLLGDSLMIPSGFAPTLLTRKDGNDKRRCAWALSSWPSCRTPRLASKNRNSHTLVAEISTHRP